MLCTNWITGDPKPGRAENTAYCYCGEIDFNALWSNPYYRAKAMEIVVIIQILMILSDQVPEFRRDDYWVFVFQYSFASQKWKLVDKYAKKCMYFLWCNLCRVMMKILNEYFCQMIPPTGFKHCCTDYTKEKAVFYNFL